MILTENNYNLNKNRYFLNWFHAQILAGYDIYLDISDFQNFIDYVTFWYESKIPNNNDNPEFLDITDISSCFTFKQLMYRMNSDIVDFLDCNYRSEQKVQNPFYDEFGNFSYMFEDICINIISKVPEKYDSFSVVCDSSSGFIKNAEELIHKNITDSDNIIIDNLLYILSTKYSNIYDSYNLKKTIFNHKIDLKLRMILIVLIGKKLLSNDDCSIDIRRFRYENFVDDFNNNIYDLKLKKEDFSNDLKVLFKY